jgi:hypothetical protein
VYDAGWKEVVNSVSAEVPLRTIDPQPSQVWSSQGLITIANGTSLNITARGSSAFINALTPVQDTDYTLVSGTVTMGLSRTSGQSTVITVTATSDAVVQDLALRAYAVQSTSVTVTVEDAVSIYRHGRKSLADGRLPVWANLYDAQAILQLIVAKRAERLPSLQVTMRGAGSAARLAECITRNLSDRVHLTESLTGLDADCFIEQIQHTITQGGTEHVTTFGVEKIPPIVATPFTFDLAGAGFDQGLFAGGALENPATMFRSTPQARASTRGSSAFDVPGVRSLTAEAGRHRVYSNSVANRGLTADIWAGPTHCEDDYSTRSKQGGQPWATPTALRRLRGDPASNHTTERQAAACPIRASWWTPLRGGHRGRRVRRGELGPMGRPLRPPVVHQRDRPRGRAGRVPVHRRPRRVRLQHRRDLAARPAGHRERSWHAAGPAHPELATRRNLEDLLAENAEHGCLPPEMLTAAPGERPDPPADRRPGRVGGLLHQQLEAAGRREIGA